LIGFFQIASSSVVAFGASAMFGMGQTILAASVFLLALVALVSLRLQALKHPIADESGRLL